MVVCVCGGGGGGLTWEPPADRFTGQTLQHKNKVSPLDF